MAALVVGLGATPALAVGDSGLSKVIIGNPVPGWVPEPDASLHQLDSKLNAPIASSIAPDGGVVRTAVEGWRDPANQGRYAIIVLVALGFSGETVSTTDAQARQAAITVLVSLCEGMASQSSVHASTVPRVPFSHTLTCTATNGGGQPLAASWSRGNVIALVLSQQIGVTVPQLDLIAATQYVHMSAHGYGVPTPPRGSSDLGLVLELLAGLVVLAVVGVFLWRFTQRLAPASGAGGARRKRGGARAKTRSRTRTRTRPRPRAAAPTPAETAKAAAQREVRRGFVQRPASLAGGTGPPSSREAKPPPPRPQP
jgi:hypothetical protein